MIYHCTSFFMRLLPTFKQRQKQRIRLSGKGRPIAPSPASAVKFPAKSVGQLGAAAKAKRKIHWERIAMAIAAVGVILSAGYMATLSEFWQVKKVTFGGDWQHLAPEKDRLQSEILSRNIFSLNVESYRQTLAANPYVADVYLQKRLPGEVHIYLKENSPSVYFASLNQVLLYDASGAPLTSQDLPQKLQVSEFERFIYTEKKPFKSPALKAKWLVDKEPQLRVEFEPYYALLERDHQALTASIQKQIEEQAKKANGQVAGATTGPTNGGAAGAEKTTATGGNAEAGQGQGPASTATTPAGQLVLPPPLNKENEYQKFIDEKYAKLPTRDLGRYFQQVKLDTQYTVSSRWGELDKLRPAEIDLPVIYSLLDVADVHDWQKLLQNQYFEKLGASLKDKFQIERREITAPDILRLQMGFKTSPPQGMPAKFTLNLNLSKDLDKQLQKFAILLAELEKTKTGFEEIDLVGEKIIVS